MGRKKRSSKLKKDDEEVFDETEKEIAHPAVLITYEFLVEHESSISAKCWAWFTTSMTISFFVVLFLESLNGPNQFDGRENRATYTILPSASLYKWCKIGMLLPLEIDAILRLVIWLCLHLPSSEVLKKLFLSEQQLFERNCLYMEMIGLIPNVVESILYVAPLSLRMLNWPPTVRAVFRLAQMCNMVRILRITKDIPAIWAVRITLYNSIWQLILPIFFFLLFNVSAGVILFFVEPCYDRTTCPWHDLFESSYFAVVSMTTTGYGDQTPQFELGRFFTLCVCFFGALFVSMPLSIIGNEYENAWTIVQEKKLREKQEKLEEKLRKQETIRNYQKEIQLLNTQGKTRSLSIMAKRAKINEENNIDETKGGNAKAAGPPPSPPSPGTLAAAAVSENESSRMRKLKRAIRLREDISAVKATSFSLSYDDLQRAIAQLARECGDMAPNNQFLHPGVLQGMNYVRDSLLQFVQQIEIAMNRLHSNFADEAYEMAIKRVSEEIPLRLMELRLQSVAPVMPSAIISKTEKNQQRPAGRDRGSIRATVHATIPQVGTVAFVEALKDHTKWAGFAEPSRSVWVRDTKSESKQTSVRVQQNIHPKDMIDAEDKRELESYTEIPVLHQLYGYAKRLLISVGILSAAVQPAEIVDEQLDNMDDQSLPRHERILIERLKDVEKDPTALTNRLWVLLEIPTSSREASYLRIFTLICILFSVFLLYTETLTSYNSYGEQTSYCHNILELYCVDKTPQSDPGCFVQNDWGTASDIPLQFHCDHSLCVGKGRNFGSGIGNTNMTCDSSSSLQAFATTEELLFKYKANTVFTSKADRQLRSNICNRIECSLDGENENPGQFFWNSSEMLINSLFSAELLARILSSGSVGNYFADKMNFVDLIVLLPFYTELFLAKWNNVNALDIDFSILPSSAEPRILVAMRSLKVLRLFKLSRHYRASRVLMETASKAWKQILSVLGLLTFFVFLFASMMFEVESGVPCYFGEKGCYVQPDDQLIYQPGDRVVIDKFGGISKISDVFDGLWYAFVTLTTVGYGDIVPITNAGRFMGILLMLAGTMYMSIPLTVAGKIYYETHSKHLNENEQNEQYQRKEIALRIAAATTAIEQSLQDEPQHIRALKSGASLAAMEAAEKNIVYELRFSEALITKCMQVQLATMHQELMDISVHLMTSVLSSPAPAKPMPILVRVRRLAKDIATLLENCKDVKSNLAELSYKREIQLSKLTS